MKIFFLTRLFFPSIGGVQKHVLEISQKAIKDKHEVTIITEKHSKKLKNFEYFKKIKIYRIPIKKQEKKIKKFRIWLWLIKNRKIFKSANLIHAHDVGFWIFPLKFLFPKKVFYITFHGYEPNYYKKNKFKKKLVEVLSNGSIAIGSYLKKWYKIKPTIISYGAATLTNFSLNQKQKYVFDACFTGRLEKDTGIEEYLKAIKLLQKKYKIKTNLVICGNGYLLEKIKRYIEKNKLPVKLVGWVNNPYRYIARSKMVFSSQYLSIIEAAQMKKMIFSIYNTDIKKDYLLSLPIAKKISISNNYVQLAENIKNFIGYPSKYKKMIAYSYTWASRQTWSKLYKEYLSLWKKK